jgi:RNA polymerase sigma-70 factor (ECF subfamily)
VGVLEDPELREDRVLRLIEQIQAGVQVEDNFAEIFMQFGPAVQSYFERKRFLPEEAKDLTQDVFFRVFRNISTFRRESRFERWLWEIATNAFRNELRRRGAEKRDAIELSADSHPSRMQEDDHEELDWSVPSEIPSEMPSGEELILLKEQLDIFRSSLQELPAQMRQCCVLRYQEGMKYQEIAREMKISIETVKAHLHQARKRLIAQLKTKQP